MAGPPIIQARDWWNVGRRAGVPIDEVFRRRPAPAAPAAPAGGGRRTARPRGGTINPVYPFGEPGPKERPPTDVDPTCPSGFKWHRGSGQCIPADMEPFIPPDRDPVVCPPGHHRMELTNGQVVCAAPNTPDRPAPPAGPATPKDPRPRPPRFWPENPMPMPNSPLSPGGPGGPPSFPGTPTGGWNPGIPLPWGLPSLPAGTACHLLSGRARQICESITGTGGGTGQPLADRCPPGTVRVGNTCVAPGDAFPGGDPFTFGAGGTPRVGAFGLPAMTPVMHQRVHRECPGGMVLGRDDLCYPKQVLSRRSQWRKWKGAPRPPVSASDMKAIRKAARARDRVAALGKDVGLHVSKTRPRSRNTGRDKRGRIK